MDKFSILILDDIKENIHSLKILINDKFDVNIFTATTVKEAISKIATNSIDLILSDIEMPDIDGFEFTEYVHSMPSTKEIPIILITGIHNDTNAVRKGYSAGVIDYITKPIDDIVLYSKLKNYIKIFELTKKLKEKNRIIVQQARLSAMSEMIHMLSHQWRQPLTTLNLTVGKLSLHNDLGTLNDEVLEESIEKSNHIIQNMSDMIERFSELFQIDSNSVNKYNLYDLVVNSEIFINSYLKDKKVSFKIDFNIQKTSIIELNKSKFYQVLLNLYKNSLDAIIEKNIEDAFIHVAVNESEFSYIIEVLDNGGGIKSSIVENIFEPYFSTKSKNFAGVGLYITKLLIEEHFKGKIDFFNKNGQALFKIVLPKGGIK